MGLVQFMTGTAVDNTGVFLVAILVYMTNLGLAVPSWGYNAENGPNMWPKTYPECSGEKQSPINIDTSSVQYSRKLVAFDFSGYETVPPQTHWQLTNTGRTVMVAIDGDYRLKDGGLHGGYRLVQFHFHWGSSDDAGGEHFIDGKTTPMELHLMHYAARYGSFDEALSHPDGIAAFAFRFKVGKVTNQVYRHLIYHLGNVSYPGDTLVMRPVPLLSLLPANLNYYYRYIGSLTTPPCIESVIWSVFEEEIELSKKQIEHFRTLLYSGDSEKKLTNNYRNLQPLNERTIYSSNLQHATVFTSPLSSPISVTLAAFFGLLLLLCLVR